MAQRRTKGKLIRLTPEEFNEIERRAHAAGALAAAYVREAALTGAAPATSAGKVAAIVHALGQIGATLRTLHRESADASTRAHTDRALAELQSLLKGITKGGDA